MQRIFHESRPPARRVDAVRRLYPCNHDFMHTGRMQPFGEPRAGGAGAECDENWRAGVACCVDQAVDVREHALAIGRSAPWNSLTCMSTINSARFGGTSDIAFLLSDRSGRRDDKTPSGTGGVLGKVVATTLRALASRPDEDGRPRRGDAGQGVVHGRACRRCGAIVNCIDRDSRSINRAPCPPFHPCSAAQAASAPRSRSHTTQAHSDCRSPRSAT